MPIYTKSIRSSYISKLAYLTYFARIRAKIGLNNTNYIYSTFVLEEISWNIRVWGQRYILILDIRHNIKN